MYFCRFEISYCYFGTRCLDIYIDNKEENFDQKNDKNQCPYPASLSLSLSLSISLSLYLSLSLSLSIYLSLFWKIKLRQKYYQNKVI